MLKILSIAVASVALAGAPTPAARTARFAPNFEAATAEARKTSRPILVKFYTSWCGWCKKMDRDTFRDVRLIDKSESELVLVALDAEDGATGSKLARKLRVSSFPFISLLDADGRELGRLPGYRPADRFIADLDRLLAGRDGLARLQEAEKAAPKDAQALWDLAQAFERERKTDEARARYEQLLALKDEKARRFHDLALWNLGEIARREEDGNRALEAYQRLINGFPDAARAEDATFEIARLHHRMGNVDDAISGYEALLKRYPSGKYANGAQLQLQALRLNYGRQ